MAKVGRPRIEIDKKQFESLCTLQCTLSDIADFFCCSIDTIENYTKREYKKNFSEVYKIHSQKGKTSLRRLQFASAERGSVPMQIWLGKQWLGQTEKTETTNINCDLDIDLSDFEGD